MGESRVGYLEHCLSILGYSEALRALDFVVKEMCAEKGFKRHDGSHYYYHLVDATQDLLNHGVRDEITIVACLKHDSVEDIDWYTIEDVERDYGQEVAKVVDLVTKKKGIDYKDPKNMYVYLDRISRDWRASLVKTADRKHNFSTLKDATREKKLRQAKETEKLFIPFFKHCRKLYSRYADYFFSAKTAIEPHLWEIKERYAEIEKLEKRLYPTLGERDILFTYEFEKLEEAFEKIDLAVDRETVSPALISLWNDMAELIAHNKENMERLK